MKTNDNDTTQRTNWRRFYFLDVYSLILKLIAAGFLFLAIKNWFLIVGLFDDAVRFDTMQFHWKLAIMVLSLLQPIVAIGLWSSLGWAFAVWMIALLVEITMYLGLGDLFGSNNPVLLFHAVCFVIIVASELAKKYWYSQESAGNHYKVHLD